MTLNLVLTAPLHDSRGVAVLGTLPEAVDQTVVTWLRENTTARIAIGPVESLDVRELRAKRPDMILACPASTADESVRNFLHVLRADGMLQSVTVVCFSSDVCSWLAGGADDVIGPDVAPAEMTARLNAILRRARRDIEVHPSTRLAGARALANAIESRIASGASFAACYADLDHFKEFNDRYGFHQGDDVIRAVADIIVEVVTEHVGAEGFVSHIGGDDFLFLVPTEYVAATCGALIARADEVLPCRYSVPDRQAGYFFGKDRRGRLDRVELMTLSVGVVSNTRRRFVSAAQVSELATEMKAYAKTLPGSVWAIDRRSDGDSVTPPEEKHQ
jgi:GGDEF domain-containing protein